MELFPDHTPTILYPMSRVLCTTAPAFIELILEDLDSCAGAFCDWSELSELEGEEGKFGVLGLRGVIPGDRQ
jgi:hypothetical protein